MSALGVVSIERGHMQIGLQQENCCRPAEVRDRFGSFPLTGEGIKTRNRGTEGPLGWRGVSAYIVIHIEMQRKGENAPAETFLLQVARKMISKFVGYAGKL